MRFDLRKELKELGIDGKITSISRLAGLTNFNFKVCIENSTKVPDGYYVLRLPGEGMDEVLVNRPNELRVLDEIHNTDLKDLAVDSVAWNAKGVKLTPFIGGLKTLDPTDKNDIIKGIKLINTMHNRDYNFGVKEDPFTITRGTLQKMSDNNLITELSELFNCVHPSKLLKYQEMYREEFTEEERMGTPTHCDCITGNFVVLESGEVKLLDFEYARMSDRFWDYLAMFYEAGIINVDEQLEILSEIMEITPRIRKRLLLVSLAISVWLSTWGYLAFYVRGDSEALDYIRLHNDTIIPMLLDELENIE